MRSSREEWRKRVERWKDGGLTAQQFGRAGHQGGYASVLEAQAGQAGGAGTQGEAHCPGSGTAVAARAATHRHSGRHDVRAGARRWPAIVDTGGVRCAAAQYISVKREAWKRGATTLLAYSRAKAAFMTELLNSAMKRIACRRRRRRERGSSTPLPV